VNAKPSTDLPSPLAAGSGCVAVALFLTGALVIGDRPDVSASGDELVAFAEANRSKIQVGAALNAAAVPFFICFLATVASLTGVGGRAVRQTGLWLFGSGLAFLTLFLADLTALAVSAMRPDDLASAPEVALVLLDFEFVAMGIASFTVVAMLTAAAILALRHGAVWPRWVGGLAVVAAALYALRAGTIFTTDGAFAADGVLGIYAPVGALVLWLVVASVVLARDLSHGAVPGTGAG